MLTSVLLQILKLPGVLRLPGDLAQQSHIPFTLHAGPRHAHLHQASGGRRKRLQPEQAGHLPERVESVRGLLVQRRVRRQQRPKSQARPAQVELLVLSDRLGESHSDQRHRGPLPQSHATSERPQHVQHLQVLLDGARRPAHLRRRLPRAEQELPHDRSAPRVGLSRHEHVRQE